ncbi:hypothetical protein CTAYLR_006840 [Chrysophaeum taylorii]|uniref:Probable threonine--tRNA ligase, cytoplasmic n=1 Tax=Chrysophaeum taylorii TaxID=2483200 RepID=A0AAD7UBG5_9STRA|nr:hypothetical protein CTAYLR_006840 [Chrysophaeum taylorii]
MPPPPAHNVAGNACLNKTTKFSVFDRPGIKQQQQQQQQQQLSSSGASGTTTKRAVGGRLSAGTEGKMHSAKIGGDFSLEKEPMFARRREEIWERAKSARAAEPKPEWHGLPISIALPDGAVHEGVAFETTPMAIAKKISKKLAGAACVARVTYAAAVQSEALAVVEDDDRDDDDDDNDTPGVLWDLQRPLEGDCRLELFDFDTKEGKGTFWHSSSHLLGAVLEQRYGSKLTIGPAVEGGFYYDAYMGDSAISDAEFSEITKAVQKITNSKAPFERLVVTKDELLEMFSENPFKVALISSKVPDGGRTTAYKSGPIIDLCMGPHLPDAGRVKAFEVVRSSAAYWLGDAENDTLQRVYGIAFPDKKDLVKWRQRMAEAAKRDHRRVGLNQKLFFFDPLSPGSAFFEPRGARIYNGLVEFIREQYWAREYDEVVTPNVYNFDLWHTSGHALHYKQNMFCFDVEGAEFGLKPMNCPGHCLMFAKTLRSWRDLPMRYADFGVLHRNEVSGSLTGLTRVRRFQQDDGHIFCREDQVEAEVKGALDFMKYVYDTFGMGYKLELSTRPKKALGDVSLWKKAEAALASAMNDFAGVGRWRVNPGDGAFYGPKIDIKVTDALDRVHQCATIQLDFQLPIRFDLKYRAGDDAVSSDDAAAPDEDSARNGELPPGYARPIIIHRAMLGSVERMIAVLTEHWGGKWPLWISPRQCLVVPVAAAHNDFATRVRARLRAAKLHVDCDLSGNTLPKKVRNGQLAQYNFILVVGDDELKNDAVSVRTRKNTVEGTVEIDDFIRRCRALVDSKAKDDDHHQHHHNDSPAASSSQKNQ